MTWPFLFFYFGSHLVAYTCVVIYLYFIVVLSIGKHQCNETVHLHLMYHTFTTLYIFIGFN